MPNNYFNIYLFPSPIKNWDAEHIRKTNQLVKPIQDWAFIFKIIGGIGAVFSTYQFMRCRFKAVSVSSTLIFWSITSFALVALGMCLNRVVNRHYVGLTKEHLQQVAVDEFKEVLKQLPVFQSQKDLEDTLKSDADFTSTIAIEILDPVNDIQYFAVPCYHPTKDIQPRFEIFPTLTPDQEQDLLDHAYQEGVILSFNHYKGYMSDVSNVTGRLQSEKLSKGCVENIQKSFICSVKFLVQHLQPLDVNKIDLINEQLRALSFKWHLLAGETKTYNPNVYLEDKDTVVIRGNSSEIQDPLWAIEQLAPYVKKIKFERQGFIFFNDLYRPNKWNDLQLKLNQLFPSKMIFVDSLDDMTDIWQKNAPQSDWKEEFKDIFEDVKRIQKINKGEKVD